MALVFTSECFTISNVYYYNCAITSDFYQRYLETFSTMFSLRLRQTIWNFYTTFDTELEKNIDASRTNFVDKLLSGAANFFSVDNILKSSIACARYIGKAHLIRRVAAECFV